MFENLVGITIKGRKFQRETDFEFWKKKDKSSLDTRAALVYGRNGSGKTTISSAFKILSGEEIEGIIAKELTDNKKELNENEKHFIHVFNEEYIDKKIKIEDNGIDSIVMFGEQVDLDKKIKEKQTELDKLEKAKSELEQLKLPKFDLDFNSFLQLGEDILNDVKNKQNEVNNEIDIFNSIIDERINNIYQNFSEEKNQIKIEEAINKYNLSLKKLETKKNNFNDLILNKNKLKNELIELNCNIANKEISNFYNEYLNKLNNKNELEQKISDLESKQDSIIFQINTLKSLPTEV